MLEVMQRIGFPLCPLRQWQHISSPHCSLSQQIVTGDDKDDEAIIARADAIHAEAIHAIEGFLN